MKILQDLVSLEEMTMKAGSLTSQLSEFFKKYVIEFQVHRGSLTIIGC